MVAELISVGTELLMGNIVNTNAQYLAEKCAQLGLSMYHQTVVGDNPDRLADAVRTALNRSDLVILTGGLGPTEDDLTKEVCAQVMGFPLEEDPHTRARIQAYFENNIYKTISQNNWKQAVVPAGARVLDNDNGTAPGLILEKDGKAAVLLPGPPGELHPLFEQQVMPYLQNLQPERIVSRMIKICGVGESQVEDRLLDLIDAQTDHTIDTYAKTAEVHLRITAKASGEDEALARIRRVEEEIKRRFGQAVFTDREEVTLEDAVVRLLKRHGLTVSTAESCTGGLVSARLVNVAGASDVFQEGFVTYSNEAKQRVLGVKEETLRQYGAVSRETAEEMAAGGAAAAGTSACVAITGLAGPGGGSPKKPVGLVYMACCLNGQVTVQKYQFKGNRSKIREQSAVRALDLLRRTILDVYGADAGIASDATV